MNEDSHSWGSEIVFLSVATGFDEMMPPAGIEIVRIGSTPSSDRENNSPALPSAEIPRAGAAGENVAACSRETDPDICENVHNDPGNGPAGISRRSCSGSVPKEHRLVIENVIREDLTSTEHENAPKI